MQMDLASEKEEPQEPPKILPDSAKQQHPQSTRNPKLYTPNPETPNPNPIPDSANPNKQPYKAPDPKPTSFKPRTLQLSSPVSP